MHGCTKELKMEAKGRFTPMGGERFATKAPGHGGQVYIDIYIHVLDWAALRAASIVSRSRDLGPGSRVPGPSPGSRVPIPGPGPGTRSLVLDPINMQMFYKRYT